MLGFLTLLLLFAASLYLSINRTVVVVYRLAEWAHDQETLGLTPSRVQYCHYGLGQVVRGGAKIQIFLF